MAHFSVLERYDGGEKCKYYRIETYSDYSGQKNLQVAVNVRFSLRAPEVVIYIPHD